MKVDIPASTETYAAAYGRLNAIAEKLKTAGAAASVDGLVDDLREDHAARAICSSRLDAIRREVDAEVKAAGGITAALRPVKPFIF